MKSGDRPITLDLKDAYFHVPICQTHRKFLRFSVLGKNYQFKALCFGPMSAPRVFTKILSGVAAHLRKHNIRLATFLDDWLLVNKSQIGLVKDRELSLNLLTKLGFIINAQKSNLTPLSGHNIYKRSFQTRQRSCVSNSRKNRKITSDYSQSVKGKCVGSELSDSARSDCFSTRVDSEQQIVHDNVSIISSSKLAPLENEFESLRNCLYSRVEITFYMVVRATKHFAGLISYPIHKSSHSDHGCIHNGRRGVTRKIKKHRGLGHLSGNWNT